MVPVSLSAPPPPPPYPFPCTTVHVPITSLPTEEYFRGRPARTHPAGLPWPGLPDVLNASRAPFRVSPPSPFHRHACPVLVAPFLLRAFCSGLRSVGDPRHARGPRDQLTALENRGTLRYGLCCGLLGFMCLNFKIDFAM